MSSLRTEAVRNNLIQRLQNLTPASKPKWGNFDASHLLCHLHDSLAMALGEVSTLSANKKAFQCFPLKHLILYVFPFPKGVPTAPELLVRVPAEFEQDRQRLIGLIGRIAAAPRAKGPVHPFFGPLDNEEWNSLAAKHISHHLKQFGI